MTKPTFCPILMIGFEAPKTASEPDLRTCKEDCEWFDTETKGCILQALNLNILELIDYTCAATMGNIENENDYNY